MSKYMEIALVGIFLQAVAVLSFPEQGKWSLTVEPVSINFAASLFNFKLAN